ncbi:MAG: general secretion pathway protein GspK [Spirochaetales bacterium]|nr:general secretion pathway protein GspK [Phycisphaerales bacterium]MCB1326087.1 general secretion pathway protein GspK [Leptospiraceae bacterium]MCP5483776.1 general secretion pathway protein GspK [Spirochaetales bacterium]
MRVPNWKNNFSRRGSILLLSIMLLMASTAVLAQQFLGQMSDQFFAVHSQVQGFKAQQLALAGFQAGIAAIKNIQEEDLYRYGIALSPPQIELGRDCPPGTAPEDEDDVCDILYVSYRLQPEDGKLNLNYLVRFDGEPDENYVGIVQRLLKRFHIPIENVGPIVDWIDENDRSFGLDGEESYYAALRPPRKVKNYAMFSLSELCQVRGFSREIVYESHMPERWEEEHSFTFATDDERSVEQPEDFLLPNNLTAFAPFGDASPKVNINAVRYNVLRSLTQTMESPAGDAAARALFKLRNDSNGYIESLSDLQALPEFQVPSSIEGTNLYQELAGTGTEASGLITTEGTYYRVVGVGSVVRPVDNEEARTLAVRRVWGIWDRQNRRLIYYAED